MNFNCCALELYKGSILGFSYLHFLEGNYCIDMVFHSMFISQLVTELVYIIIIKVKIASSKSDSVSVFTGGFLRFCRINVTVYMLSQGVHGKL